MSRTGWPPEAGEVDESVVLLARFADLAVAALGEAREGIDALNVFPVPDADTGTNMFLTLEAARDAVRDRLAEGRATRTEAFSACSRAALLGARGNSGVILSQLLGQVLRRVRRAGADEPPAVVLAEGLVAAADAAYAAVGRPVEGTMLSVARAAAAAAHEAACTDPPRVATVLRRSVEAAREALARTPDQLPRLAEAGVVDAGGAGLCLVLEAAERAVTGRLSTSTARSVPVPLPHAPATDEGDGEGPAYEVMYLLDAPGSRLAALRTTLDALGDSLVVVGEQAPEGDEDDAGLWHVHVHVDDAGAAIEAGIAAGTPRRIRVTHLAEHTPADRSPREGRRVLAVSAGPGLAALFETAGAVVLEGGPGRRPATAVLLEAIAGCGAAEVVVLPNDAGTHRAAEAAARQAEDLGVKVVVVPTGAQVQGIAALAVHEPGRGLESDVVAMTSAARHARHGAVTLAVERAMTSVGPCEPGDALGAIESDFVLVDDDLDTAAQRVLRRLLDNGGELVTLVPGVGGDGLAERLTAWVERTYPGVDVAVHDGGQERYPLLLGVE